jgi:thiol-disulfide isomerase/thioredoxin
VSPAQSRWGGAAGLALLYTFSLIVLVALALGRRPECRCFGSVRSAPVGARTLGRNLGLAVAAAYVAAPLLRGYILELTLLAVAGVAVALGIAVVHLRRQLDRPAPPAVAADPLIGTPAPPFDLAAAAAGRVSLTSLLETGKPAMLLFMGVNCQVCHRMIPTVKRWHAEHAAALTVAVVMRDSMAANMMFDSGGPDVLLQAREEVSEAYGVTLTPAAVAIGPDGRIASGIATGPDEIAALVARLTRPS